MANNYSDRSTKINVLSSLILTTVSILSGFIIPKLILSNLGSEVNGLYLSLDQYLNFFSLLEGGLGGVVMASLYKPLYERDMEKVSSIIVTVTKFFRKIAILFIAYLLAVSFLYPLIVDSSLDYGFIASLSFVLGVNFFVRYYFLLVVRMLLQADRRLYITAFVQSILIIVEIILFILVIKSYPSIHLIKLVSSFVYIIQYLVLQGYVKRHYKLDMDAKPDNQLIKQRWDGMGIMAAAFIHKNTDLILLTSFSDLFSISIYTVYNMVVNALASIISSIVSALTPTIGMYIAKGHKEELRNAFEIYEFLMTFISFVLYTTCALVIVPFVMIYTKGVTDANYFQPSFALLVCLVQLEYCMREPSTTLLYAANRYKDMRRPAYLEAFLNILISIILIQNYGLLGIAVGTLVSTMVRHALQIKYLKNDILHRGYTYSIKLYTVFSLGFLILYFSLSKIILSMSFYYLTWILLGTIVFTITLVSFSLISLIFFKKQFKQLIKTIRAKV